MQRTITGALALVLTTGVLAACGGSDSADTAASGAAAAATTAAAGTAPSAATTAPAATQVAPDVLTIKVVDEKPVGGVAKLKVKKGDQIRFTVDSDSKQEVHLHGYDIEKPVTAGEPVRIPFTANLPGRFELELHHPDALLAVIEVRP